MLQLNLVGLRFANLSVINICTVNSISYKFHCKCDCGRVISALGGLLINGTVRSCGCIGVLGLIYSINKYHDKLKNDIKSKINRNKTRDRRAHGLSDHPMYCRWTSMIARCYNDKSSGYKNYGARGITVCERWFMIENYIEDVGLPPFHGAELDRIDNDGNYCKENCRWVDRKMNADNKKHRVYVIYKDEKVLLSKLVKGLGLKYTTVFNRLMVLGWTLEAALELR